MKHIRATVGQRKSAASGGLRDFPVSEGERGLRVQAVERADQLAAEDIEAMERAAFAATAVEPKAAPKSVSVPLEPAEAVEVRLPLSAAVAGAYCLRQRGVERIVRGDPEQLAGGVVDEVRQLLRFILGEQGSGLEAKVLLELGDGGKKAEDEQVHARRIDEIRACSKAKCQRIHRFTESGAGPRCKDAALLRERPSARPPPGRNWRGPASTCRLASHRPAWTSPAKA